MSARPAARLGALVLLLNLLAVAACSAPSESSRGSATVVDGVVDVSAREAEFDVAIIEAPAGQPFTVRFANGDGVAHNFAVYADGASDAVAQGALVTGPGTTTEVAVPALDPGSYVFRCDPHAGQMTGVLAVHD